ncbi:MAG: tetratricopeptide repeat protein [Planctomycetota bacterium]
MPSSTDIIAPRGSNHALPPGQPPVDAAAILGVPPELPENVEEINEEALTVGQLTVKTLPNRPEAYVRLAFTYLQLGQDREALESWRKVVELDEDFSDAYLGMGSILKDLGEHEKAIAAFRKGIELDPDLEHAYRELTELLLLEGKPEEALQVAQECVDRFPSVREHHFWLGQTYKQLGDYEKAFESHQEAVRIDPEFTLSHHALAPLCARLGKREKAVKYRERFAELKEEELERDRNRARTYDDFLTQRAPLVKRHVLSGVLQLKSGNPRIAEAHWLRASAIDPEDRATRKALASLYEKQARPAAAIQVLQELIGLEPNNPQHRIGKGRLLVRMESWSKAKKPLTTAIALDGEAAEAHLLLAQVHLGLGADLATARSHAERGVRLKPSPDGYALLAAVRAECGDPSGARAALKEALSLEPDNMNIRRAYEQLLAAD